MKSLSCFILALFVWFDVLTLKATYPYQDTGLSVDARVKDLISRMTIDEKISQLGNQAAAISRLGVKSYNYWSEALHGVARQGLATSFPQPIGMSATWDPDLIYKIATATSDEARVKNNMNGTGLTYWCPVVNMARDPRWGRSEENFGEDTYLASQMAVNFIRGMQGNNPKYLKTVATAKHFALNNVENNRYGISSNVDDRSLREYFLPTFKACVTEGKVYSIMSAYNAVNGVPCPANRTLLKNILRDEWGFKGFVVSDCDAAGCVYGSHRYVSTGAEATAISIRNGTDINCGNTYRNYAKIAVSNGILTEADIDSSLFNAFKARFLLGEFDPSSSVPYTSIPNTTLDCEANRSLALRAAREAIVLLKNSDSILPLNKDSINSIAVIGPNANVCELGEYSGTPSVKISPLQGIKEKLGIVDLTSPDNKTVKYALGCSVNGTLVKADIDSAVNLAKKCDIAILICGTDIETGREDRDRTDIGLPGAQEQMIKAVFHANPKTILVLVNGFSLAVNWEQDSIPAILAAWFDGQAQGTAIADVLFGDYNPGGKLSTTWYKSVSDLPPMDNYDIKNNRTYMYFKGTPLYPFGYGLSYTTFDYSNLQLSSRALNSNDTIIVSADIKNTGKIAGDEVVQLYTHVNSTLLRPIKELKGFSRISLLPGETKTVSFSLKYEDLQYYDVPSKTFMVESSEVDLFIGSSSADIKLQDQISVSGGTVSATFRQNPFSIVQSEFFDNKSKTVSIKPCEEICLDSLVGNSYVVFKNFDFKDEAKQFAARLAANKNGSIDIVLDSLNGTIAGSLAISPAGINTFTTQYSDLSGINGLHDIYLVFKGGNNSVCRFNWFGFQKNKGDVVVGINEKKQDYEFDVYPNPSNSDVFVKYYLTSSSDAKIQIYNSQGRLVKSFMLDKQTEGFHEFKINASSLNMESGIYIISFNANLYSKSKRLMIIK